MGSASGAPRDLPRREAAAAARSPLAIAFASDRVGAALGLGSVDLGPFVLHPLSLVYALSGSLMISTFRVPKP